MYICPKLPRTH